MAIAGVLDLNEFGSFIIPGVMTLKKKKLYQLYTQGGRLKRRVHQRRHKIVTRLSHVFADTLEMHFVAQNMGPPIPLMDAPVMPLSEN